MEGEMGTGARIAITLIVLGFLISVVFTILGFTRSTTNQGITSVQNSLDAMQLATFDDYDQQIKSGTEVLTTLKLFEGRPVGVVVRTSAQQAIIADSGHNYGAMYTGTNAATKVVTLPAKAANQSWYVVNIATDMSGTMKFNLDTLDAKRSGTVQFIRPTARFLGELIKDTTGTIVGVSFTQQ